MGKARRGCAERNSVACGFRCRDERNGSRVIVGGKKSGPRRARKVRSCFNRFWFFYFGEVLLPLGETDGGQGVPGVGLRPLFACVPPVDVEGDVLPGVALEVPGVELDDALVEPGKVPHGEPLGLVGVAVWLVPLGLVLGLVPGVVVLGVVVVFGVPVGDVEPGVGF